MGLSGFSKVGFVENYGLSCRTVVDANVNKNNKIDNIFFQVTDPNLGFLVNRSCVQIHIEWLQSTLLFQSTYHHYDDITRIQTYQMR